MDPRKNPSRAGMVRIATLVTAGVTGLALATAPAAFADRRKPAPIVYAGQGSTSDVSPSANVRSVQPTTPSQPSSTSRREFRYPGESELLGGQGSAREYALAEPSIAPPLTSSTEPAISAGRFGPGATVPVEPNARYQPAGASSIAPPPIAAAPQPTGAVFQPVTGAVYDETGSASVFDPQLNGEPTANGEILDTQAMVAAHPSLPLPSLVHVINLTNGNEIVLRVNDRGPFDNNGLLEVSERAAELLGFGDTRYGQVRVRYLGPAPDADGSRPSAPLEVRQPPVGPRSAPTLIVASQPLIDIPASRPAPAAREATPPALVRPIADPGSRTPPAGKFLIQLASFADISNAQRMHASLSGAYRVNIVPARVRGADYFRVIAGPVSGRQEAENLRDRLANQGIANGLVITAP